MGRFNPATGGFEITVAADYNASVNDLYTEWSRALIKVAEHFYDATNGQLRIDRFLIANNSYGLAEAEIVLHAEGEASYASLGGFGRPGSSIFPVLQQIHLMPDCKLVPMVVVHELGHHILSLGEEYAAPPFEDEIRLAPGNSPAPDESHTAIPISNPARAGNALVSQVGGRRVLAGMQRGTLIERREIAASTGDLVTIRQPGPGEAPALYPPFTFLPSQADGQRVFYQDERATCHEGTGVPPHGFWCIMQNARAGGQFTPTGLWQPPPSPPGTVFCSPLTHEIGNVEPAKPEPDSDQSHHNNGEACWETVVRIMAETYGHTLVVPEPPPTGPAPGSPLPGGADELLEYLLPERRVALVIDRSGSMGQGEKMAHAKEAAQYWVQRMRLQDPDAKLAVIAYDHEATVLHDLAAGSDLDLGLHQQIGAIQPGGSTGIVAGLAAARTAIRKDPPRPATQAVLLLTDGVHNFPAGTQPADVLPGYRDDRIQIFSVGLGDANADHAIDMAALEHLAAQTGAAYPFLASSATAAQVLTQQLYDFILGGLVASEAVGFSALSSPSVTGLDPKKRPPLRTLLKKMGVGSVGELIRPPRRGPASDRGAGQFRVVRAHIEAGSPRAAFTLAFPPKQPLWLYLIGPDGDPHLMDGADTEVRTLDRTEFAVVDRPRPGQWLMVAFRPYAGGPVTGHAFAGSENRRLVVAGTATTDNTQGAPVLVRASVLWGDRLSGCRVTAELVGPDGSRSTVLLSDATATEPDSGAYQGVFIPTLPGRYQGTVRVEGGPQARSAQLEHRISHAIDDLDVLTVPTVPSRFVRLVPFSFWSGDRPKRPAPEEPGP